MGQDRKPPRGNPKLREKAEARLQSKEPEFQEVSLDAMSILVHELQVHQIELETQNEALRQSQISLEEANRKYSDFYDFAPVGFLTLDESGLIREVNLTAASQLGATRRHLVDKPFSFFVDFADRDRFCLYLGLVFQEPGPQHSEIKLQRKDGEIVFAHLHSVAVTDVSGARLCRMSITDISDLKEAEQKLQASERLFASFVGHLPSIAVIRDLEGRYLFVNDAVLRAFHNTREEWLGKTVEDLWPPEVVEKFKAQDQLLLETKKPVRALDTLRHPDGLHHYIYYTFPIVDQEGNPVMIGTNAVDVTEHLETKARLDQVLDSGPAAIYTCDPEMDFALSFISENTKTLVGWEARDFLADSRFWLNHVHPEDRPRVLKRLELPWPEDHQTIEYRFLAQDGAYRWMHDEVRLVRDKDGKPVEIAGAWMDITARKQMEEALGVSLRFLEIVHSYKDFNSLLTAFMLEIKDYTGCEAVGIRVLDAAGGILYQAYDGFRPQFYELENSLGIRSDQCVCTNVITGDCNPRLPFYTAGGSFWMNHTTRFLATVPEEDKGNTRNVCNQEGYESVALIPIRWGNQIMGLIHIADRRENMVPLRLVEMLEKAAMQLGTALERVKAEEALRESEANYRLLVNQIPAVVFKGYQDWSIDFFDDKIEALSGYRKEEFDSREIKWRNLILPEDLDMVSELFIRALNTEKSYVREYRIQKKNGEIAWIQARGQIFCDAAGRVDYVSGVLFDITEHKVLEAQLLQAQKMEAVGRLAGGVAHDFNNLLMAIMGYGELIRTNLVRDDPLYKYSEDILKATERAASLTQQLLAFSRRQVTQPQVLNLNRVVADLEKMLQRLIGEHIELNIVAGPDLGAVRADPGQIGQIIMNLAVNARDAMPTGGRLILAADNIEFDTSHECRFENIPPGPYVRLSVTDTGSGMDAETLDHIFEPFFTTKEMGKGTGLGLPMVYGIVQQNGGCVDVESQPGQGATFKIYLPRIEAAVEAAGAKVSLVDKLEGSETILVVEDEDALRTLLCRFFRLYGYNVIEARHGGEALLICERHPGPIHLMITDVVMPQMSGKELADRLAPLHPEMAVFFMSGYTDSDLTGYGALESTQHFISKPFRPMDLVKKVRDFLDASPGITTESPPP
jgi:PAS domain S-box-containing protein